MKSKTYSKKQLSQLMNISPSKLQKLLNVDWYDEISQFGYKKNNKILSPKVFSFIKRIWWDNDENENN